MTLADYETFRWFMLHLYRISNKISGLKCQKIIPLYDDGALKVMLQFLYADIAKLVAPELQQYPYSQLDRAALALYRPSNVAHELGARKGSWWNLWNSPYDYSLYMSARHKMRFLMQPVLTAAFNADLDGLKKHLESISPKARKALLSEKGTITIEHLQTRYPNIKRRGTPLQMAIYGDDEEMVGYLKTQMDEDEFHNQCREVFEEAINNASDDIKLSLKNEIASLKKENMTTEDYFNVMREVQRQEAAALFVNLRKMFTINVGDFTYDRDGVASTTSTTLPGQVNAFKQKILDYVKTHPIHNPYLLQYLYEIYDNLSSPFPSSLPRYSDYDRDSYFSQKIIGTIESFLSLRWLQHFTQSIEDLGDKKIAPHRSFICVGYPGWDIRRLVSSCIGEDSVLSLFGCGIMPGGITRCEPGRNRRALLLRQAYKTYVEQKHHAFKTCYAAGQNLCPQI